MKTLKELEELSKTLKNSNEKKGLQAFINLTKKLPRGVTILGKIQAHFMDKTKYEALKNVKSIEEIKNIVGKDYHISIEE